MRGNSWSGAALDAKKRWDAPDGCKILEKPEVGTVLPQHQNIGFSPGEASKTIFRGKR